MTRLAQLAAKVGVPVLTFALGWFAGGADLGSAFGPGPAAGSGPAVTGIGGIFFKAGDPARARAWYREHLGLEGEALAFDFLWRPRDADAIGRTVWSLFPQTTDYFGPGEQQFMINYRVRNLDALLAKLQAEGVPRAGEIEEYWYGRFAWIVDGEGNRVELWEPVDMTPEEFERRLRGEAAR